MTGTDSLLDRLSDGGAAPETGHTLKFTWLLLGILLASMVGVALVLDGVFVSVVEYGWGPTLSKWGFSFALLVLSGAALWVLGRPGRRTRWWLAALALPFVPVFALLTFELAIADPIVWRPSWRTCLAAMTIISPIAFAVAIYAMRLLAPTELRRAGLVAGLFGGAVAMTAYTPFCPEIGMVYMTVFYLGPIAAMAAIGWVLGPRLLRW